MELDWTDRNAYKELTQGYNDDQWRWEFLRRAPEYQRAWKTRSLDLDIASANAYRFGLENFIDPQIPSKQLGDHIKFVRQTGYQLHDVVCTISHHFPKKEAQELDREFFTTSIRRILNDKECAVFVFDITRPILEQINHVKSTLVKLQEGYRSSIESQLKNSGYKLPKRGKGSEIPEIIINQITPNINQLRTIDARSCDASFSDIGKIIFHVLDDHEAGKRGKDEYLYAVSIWRLLSN